MKIFFIKKYSRISIFLFLIIPSFTFAQKTPTKIACVGNSITYGYGLNNPETESYPGQLQTILGINNWHILNFGISSRTMLKTGDLPYWNESQYTNALAYNPNIVMIELGTNDSKRWIWNKHGSEFPTDYKEMIESFRKLDSKPDIWIGLLIPGENTGWDIYNSYIKDSVNPQILKIAIESGVGLIDLYDALNTNNPAWYMTDGVHPTIEGCVVIANTVMNVITMEKPTISLLENGYLDAPEGFAYQWYKNGKMISDSEGGTKKQCKPNLSGSYTVSIKINAHNETRIISKEYILIGF